MSDIDDLTKQIVAFCQARDWQQFHNPKDVTLSLMLEAGEILEHFQWMKPEEIEAHIKEHRAEIGEELADVLWYVLLLAHYTDIDVKQALIDKIKKNEARYSVKSIKGKHTNKFTKPS